MTDTLKQELKAASYTMPGISKKEMIDLDKVFEILENHLKEPESIEQEQHTEYY